MYHKYSISSIYNILCTGCFKMIDTSICLVVGLHGIMWTNIGGKIWLRSEHFNSWFLKFQQTEFCLPNSSVSEWGWILNLNRKYIFINHHDLFFALISRHFIGLVQYFTGRRELYQRKQPVFINWILLKFKLKFKTL